MKRKRFIRLFFMVLLLTSLSRCQMLSAAAIVGGSDTAIGGAGSIGMRKGGGDGTTPPATKAPAESTGTSEGQWPTSSGDGEDGGGLAGLAPNTGDNGILFLFLVIASVSLLVIIYLKLLKRGREEEEPRDW